MRKLIIIAGGLTLLVLASVGFWFLLPRSELGEETVRSLNRQQEHSVVEEAAVKGDAAIEYRKAIEIEPQGPAKQAKALAEALEAEAKLRGDAEQQRLAEQLKAQAEALAKEEQRAAAIKEEEQRRTKAGAEAEATRRAEVERQASVRADSERKARAPADDRIGSFAQTPAASLAENDRKAQATGGDNEIRKLQQARQALERLPKGKIVLDAPKAMNVGDTRAVYANVGINVPIELLQKHSRPTDQSHEAALSVSSEMAATLTGPGFAITPTTPEQQGVAEGFPTVWSWNVEAKQEGEQELEATLYVLLPTRQRIDSYTHKIGVSVKAQSWGEWLKSSKEEVEAVHVIAITFGSALMAVLGWLGLSYSRRRQTENRNQPETT